MSRKVCAFLAEGCEESEVLIPVDLLRRGDIDVTMVSISNEKQVIGSHKIILTADALFDDVDYKEYDALFLPGGVPGTPNLRAHKGLEEVIRSFYNNGKYITAICAAPSIFGEMELLRGVRATAHTSRIDALKEAGAEVVEDEAVVVSGNIVTSRGMGTAIAFGLRLVSLLNGEEMAKKIQKAIVY